MARLTLRAHRESDLDVLAAMNRALIEDQGHRNPMDVPALRRRFDRFVAEGRSIDVFERADTLVGFASHQEEETQVAPSGRQFHLHQFYIDRAHRRGGLGREAFGLLVATRWRPGARVVIDVLEANPIGRRFWESLGFVPYALTMETFLPPGAPGA